MTNIPSPSEALQKAVDVAGSQSALAMFCHVGQPAVSKWLQVGRVPAEYVLRIEAETGVSRHHLRPDIYPVDLPEAGTRFLGTDEEGRNGNRNNALDGEANER